VSLAWQLIIGEDTDKHIANLIWIYDFNTTSLIRIAATPMGSETTSPYWYTIGEWSYLMFVVQHPYGADTIHSERDPWKNFTAQNPTGELFNLKLFSQGPCSLTSEHAPQGRLLGLALWVPFPRCSLPLPPPPLQPRRPAPPCPSPAHAVSSLRETSIAVSSRCMVVLSCRLSWTTPAHWMPGVESSECVCPVYVAGILLSAVMALMTVVN
jgi:hypothetical protein